MNKDWKGIINKLKPDVDRITSRHITPSSNNFSISNYTPQSFNENIFKYSIKTLAIIYAISFFIISIVLYYFKPGFMIVKTKNEKTFFIEESINYKILFSISTIISLIIAYLYYRNFS